MPTPPAPPTPPRRVLMTADTVGGVWTYALELARALAAQDVQVALATMGRALTPAQRRAAAALPNVEVHESEFRLEWMPDPWEDVARAGAWLLELEARVAPALVHLNQYAFGALPWRAPVVLTAHSCVLSWWEAVKGEPAPEEWSRYREAVTAGLRGTDLVVAPSRAMLAALERHYGPLPATRVVRNGRDPARFPGVDKEPLVLTVGRLWDEAKNVATLAAAARGLAWPVYVAGDAQHPSGRTTDLGGLRALGALSDEEVAGWLARASVYALPARYEPFGLSALEAGLAGCALVLGDIPSLREVWGDAALYVRADDPASLRAALDGLIADPARRRRYALLARQQALRHAPHRMARGYLEAYADVLRTRHHSEEASSCAS